MIFQNFLKFRSPNGSWNFVWQFWNITRGIYAKYHYQSCYYLYKFPLCPSRNKSNSWITRARRQRKLRFNLDWKFLTWIYWPVTYTMIKLQRVHLNPSIRNSTKIWHYWVISKTLLPLPGHAEASMGIPFFCSDWWSFILCTNSLWLRKKKEIGIF